MGIELGTTRGALGTGVSTVGNFIGDEISNISHGVSNGISSLGQVTGDSTKIPYTGLTNLK